MNSLLTSRFSPSVTILQYRIPCTTRFVFLFSIELALFILVSVCSQNRKRLMRSSCYPSEYPFVYVHLSVYPPVTDHLFIRSCLAVCVSVSHHLSMYPSVSGHITVVIRPCLAIYLFIPPLNYARRVMR